MESTPKIFLSYSWTNSDIADQIDEDFKSIGITLIRDIRNVQYKDSILDYMKRIRDVDYVIMILSDAFFTSQNCMYEVLELYKEKDFTSKLLQVFLSDAKIFDAESRLYYIRYWEQKYVALKEKAEGSDLKNLVGLSEDLRMLDNICNTIGDFLKLLSQKKGITFSQLKENNYGDILNYIGYSESNLAKKLLEINQVIDEDEKDLLIDAFLFNNPQYYLGYFFKAEQDRKSVV